MSIVERKQRQKESLRQQILDASREILLTKGYAYLSMRRIAELIEYSPTTIYFYFKNKEDILYHLSVEALERQLEFISAATCSENSPLLRLRQAMRAYIDFGLSEPDRYKIIYMADISQFVSSVSILEEGGPANKLRDLLRNRVNDILAESRSTLDQDIVIQCLWAHIHGIVALLIGRPDFPWVDHDALIETGLDISLSGLAVQSTR
ncbi:MAG TPA: TetR/AcrR family transcriptional regulator [Geobacteraceae bacterium]|nr:TetR/AcrR family transcriptional regulator [Geobacteraceae bacterium]